MGHTASVWVRPGLAAVTVALVVPETVLVFGSEMTEKEGTTAVAVLPSNVAWTVSPGFRFTGLPRPSLRWRTSVGSQAAMVRCQRTLLSCAFTVTKIVLVQGDCGTKCGREM